MCDFIIPSIVVRLAQAVYMGNRNDIVRVTQWQSSTLFYWHYFYWCTPPTGKHRRFTSWTDNVAFQDLNIYLSEWWKMLTLIILNTYELKWPNSYLLTLSWNRCRYSWFLKHMKLSHYCHTLHKVSSITFILLRRMMQSLIHKLS